ncbi:RHS repeat-associated core domain-containing protein [Kitasatospora saccharophila]|uniref:RHS repeat-associated core domain-containing protein n=1 Tax=Kitasatospora saccharophila TaxID=407973 RepID=UPI0031DF84F9
MTAVSLTAPAASAGTVIGGYAYTGKLWKADPLPALPQVSSGNASGLARVAAAATAKGSRELRTHQAAAPSWPAGSEGVLDVGRAANVGPVRVTAAPEGASARTAKAPASVKVETADRAGAQAANVDGLLVGLESADGSASGGAVSVAVDYGSIAQAYGGGWASRLHLVQMPACALTTPQYASCRTQQPLETVNDPVTHQLTATVQLPARDTSSGALKLDAVTGSGTAVAAVSDTGGSQGSYTATSLSASGSWTQSASGAFTYSYPIALPASLGGSAPSVALSYNSQSVDGKTSARNSQASWIGDGWDYSPGFVERSYRPCDSDGITDSGDECWDGDNATLSLGSRSGELIRDSSGAYHLQNDDGTRIEKLSGASNGMWNGEYFKVTTTDGTQYYFGVNHTPGTTSDAPTNSAWAVPVYHPKAGDPCYSAASGKDSQCSAQPAWRWNLDFVVDPAGNVQRYDWAAEANSYNRGLGQVAAAGNGGTMTAYTRGGYLTQLSYGYQLADARAGHDPAAKVVFTPAQRCTTSDAVCQYANLSASTATNWPDVPYNLNCTQGMATSGAGANVCRIGAPTFWSTVRLKSVTTKVKTAGGWQDVDSYELTHLFSDAGGVMDPVTGKTVDPADAGQLQAVMWLSQIRHTGLDTSAGGSGTVALDPVVFTGVEMDNRVDGGPAAPPLYRPRISQIQTETGEQIAVKYRDPECSRTAGTMPASADRNTMACFPVYWAAAGVKDPSLDWFHKTLVEQVSDNDRTKAGSPSRITTYAYGGGAAWHRDDSDRTDDQYRTWNDFRGYRTVTVTTGAAPDPVTQSTTSYFQGMDGDYKADGSRRSVSLSNSLGESSTDGSLLAGTPQESDTYDRAGGKVVAKSLSSVPEFTSTVSRPRTAWTSKSPAPPLSTLPDLTGYRVKSSGGRTLTLLSDGSWRTVQTSTTYDGLGRPERTDDKGDLADPSQESCTTTSYATPPSGNPMMLGYVSEVLGVAGPCTTAAGPTTTISDQRLFYDGDGSVTSPGTFGQLGTNGYLTATQSLASYDSAGKPVYRTVSGSSYDGYGRLTRTVDATGAATTLAFSPTTGTLPTQLTRTNSVGWTSSSTLAPARGLVTHAVDANGRVSDSTYDALGRVTQAWTPGRDKATSTPDRTFGYEVHGTGDQPDPTAVTTRTLRENGSYAVSVDIYDGFLSQRQKQTTPADNSSGRLVSSQTYDSHGWPRTVVSTWAEPLNAPSSTMLVEDENTLPSEAVTTYDGLGRNTAITAYGKAHQLWQSTTAYPGADRTDTTPPPGGVPGTVITDALGRTTSTVAHGGPGIGDVTTSYGYGLAGRLATVKDTLGNTWSYTYDLQGRAISQSDPDSGTSTTSYDQYGRIASTTDGRGQTLSYAYDQLDRRIGEYAGTSTTDATKQLAGWTYDTLAKGFPASSTRYVGGSGTGGSAYVEEVTGYNTAYQRTGTKVTVPAAEGKLAGSYTLGADYTPNVGLVAHTTFGADGGLPSESVGYGYNLQGGLVSSGSGRFTHYLDVANYSPLGQVLQSTYGDAGKQFRTAQTYDDTTGRLATSRVSVETATNALSDTTYGYDQAGKLTTVSDRQSTGATTPVADTQCFGYDGLNRLTTAWTDTAGTTVPTAGQLATCNSTAPSAATVGGPAPYWQSWQYDLLGDRTQQVQHDLTGNTAKDTTQTSSYPGNGTTKADQPNRLTTVTTTGPTGTTVLTPQYDAAGNTTTRTTTGATTAAQKLCYDEEGRTRAVDPTDCATTAPRTSYLYDAGGSLLIQRGPTGTTLYLFGGAEQLTLDKATQTVSGLRHYRNPDGTTIVRSSSGALTYQAANQQGTAQLQVDATTLAPTRRAYDPYGNPRGTQPTGWADNRGYLGQPADPGTGLDLLGARNYDPALGRFLTVDPILQAGDPNQMGGYTYAGDDPVSSSDPSGLSIGSWIHDAWSTTKNMLSDPEAWKAVGETMLGGIAAEGGGMLMAGGVAVCGGSAGTLCWASAGMEAVGVSLAGAGVAAGAKGGEDLYKAYRNAQEKTASEKGPATHDTVGSKPESEGASATRQAEDKALGEKQGSRVRDELNSREGEPAETTGGKDTPDEPVTTKTDASDPGNGTGEGPSGPKPRGKSSPTREAVGIKYDDVPDNWTINERLETAQAKKREQMQADQNQRIGKKNGRVWSAGVHIETGEIAVASSGSMKGCEAFCAEGNVVQKLGGDWTKVRFTQSDRVLTRNPFAVEENVGICDKCITEYYPQQFPEGTNWGSEYGRIVGPGGVIINLLANG